LVRALGPGPRGRWFKSYEGRERERQLKMQVGQHPAAVRPRGQGEERQRCRFDSGVRLWAGMGSAGLTRRGDHDSGEREQVTPRRL